MATTSPPGSVKSRPSASTLQKLRTKDTGNDPPTDSRAPGPYRTNASRNSSTRDVSKPYSVHPTSSIRSTASAGTARSPREPPSTPSKRSFLSSIPILGGLSKSPKRHAMTPDPANNQPEETYDREQSTPTPRSNSN
ncbi:hypothetical protein R3P38DRAFT_3237689 [Favolaschia claudopus]|uniref:Uncharacterized protein n=1 Tax=Favolaschia claudopus TaxID=2862362 RepID=A0AAV9ZB93_9AGAR